MNLVGTNPCMLPRNERKPRPAKLHVVLEAHGEDPGGERGVLLDWEVFNWHGSVGYSYISIASPISQEFTKNLFCAFCT